MKLDVMTKCGPISATEVDGEAVEAFLDAYEDGTAPVLRVPDGSETKRVLVDRESIVVVTADVDAPAPEPDPAPELEPADAVDGDATEESSTR